MFKIQLQLRVTLVVALLFCHPLLAKTVKKTSNSKYKKSIEKAYEFSQQQNRLLASAELIEAMKKEDKKSKAYKELAETLEQIANIFFTDKAQQLYELSLSVKNTDLNMSISRAQEALKVEPNNVSILLSLARTSLLQQDCVSASGYIERARKVHPQSEDANLAYAQSLVCAQQWEKFFEFLNTEEFKFIKLNALGLCLEAEALSKTNKSDKALEVLSHAQKQEPQYPEPFYWRWKILNSQGQKAEKPARSYVTQCKNLSTRAMRKYIAEPFLCRRLPEVEEYLKKLAISD